MNSENIWNSFSTANKTVADMNTTEVLEQAATRHVLWETYSFFDMLFGEDGIFAD